LLRRAGTLAHPPRLPRRLSRPHRATPSARSGCWSTAACCCARPPRPPSRRSRSSRAPWRAWRARSPCARCARLRPPRRQARRQTIQGRGPRHARRRAARRGAAGARPPWLPPRAAAARGVLTRAPGLAQEGQGRDAEDDAWRHFQDVLRSPERGRYSGVVGVLRMITRQVPGTHCRKARPGLPCRVCETVVRVSRGVVRRVLAAVMLPLNCAAHFCSMCIVAGCST